MKLKLILCLGLSAFLVACKPKNQGLNPAPQTIGKFSAVHKVINYLKDMKREQTIRLDFSLHSLNSFDSTNTFLFTITGLRLEPMPPYLPEVADFDSLQTVLASRPYEVTVDKAGRVLDTKGEDQMQDAMFGVFSSRYIARSYTADNLSANAVEDLLNRFFSAVPFRAVKESDQWVKDLTLITKAPVKLSNLFTYERSNGDSIFIQNKTLISADQGDASTVYMKGEQLGEVIISATTRMPYYYKTKASAVTTTVAGEQNTDELWEIRKVN